jgi:hypothetical protein
MRKIQNQVYCEQRNLFYQGAEDALYMVGTVLTAHQTNEMVHMHDRRWVLTKAAQHEFRAVVDRWFDNNFTALNRAVNLGQYWTELGITFMCSVINCGGSFLEMSINASNKEDKIKLDKVGKKLYKAAEHYYDETFDLYIIRGKYCAFHMPLPNN